MTNNLTQDRNNPRPFEERVFARFDALESAVQALSSRVEKLDARVEKLDARVEQLDVRAEKLDTLSRSLRLALSTQNRSGNRSSKRLLRPDGIYQSAWIASRRLLTRLEG